MNTFSLTKRQYDSLPEKDTDAIYFIVDDFEDIKKKPNNICPNCGGFIGKNNICQYCKTEWFDM